MKSDKRFADPLQSVSNKTFNSQHQIQNGLNIKRYRSANPGIRRASAISYDIGTIQEECLNTKPYDSFRRMSAPELPPILDSRKYSNTQINMGNGTEYFRTRSNKMSNNSDSSQKGVHIRRSPLSAGSSSSSARNSANASRKLYITTTPEQTTTTIPEGIKLDAIKQKNGISVGTPRSVVTNGFRTTRLPSKDMSTSSGNNNSKSGGQNKFYHCASEPRIQPIENFMGSKGGKPTMKRNYSDNKLTQNKKLISIEKTQNLTQNNNKYNSGNVNGMRRYSSTVQLNSIVRNKQENQDDEDDDDTDSESGKDQMIIEWLIGVEKEEVEIPPDPLIEYAETPVQTDTAIHIVYSES
ncbi:Hypothetical predicted protein [Mytilus galloprovincialis]|uniref:Uncharacterized protein n=1 Tax=Mytilus galloprovincialis TaxID=29158 RepID=A0A8B6DIT8_MYTGA|nr:Hypothetical predicted protein [Mytilus galloprovincialis]